MTEAGNETKKTTGGRVQKPKEDNAVKEKKEHCWIVRKAIAFGHWCKDNKKTLITGAVCTAAGSGLTIGVAKLGEHMANRNACAPVVGQQPVQTPVNYGNPNE